MTHVKPSDHPSRPSVQPDGRPPDHHPSARPYRGRTDGSDGPGAQTPSERKVDRTDGPGAGREEFARIIGALLDRELPPDVLGILHAARRMGEVTGTLDSGLLMASADVRTWKHLAAVARGLGASP